MVPIVEAISIPFVAQAVDKESGAFKPSDVQDKAVVTLLDELARWTTALATFRA
jgi:hypothetical protein